MVMFRYFVFSFAGFAGGVNCCLDRGHCLGIEPLCSEPETGGPRAGESTRAAALVIADLHLSSEPHSLVVGQNHFGLSILLQSLLRLDNPALPWGLDLPDVGGVRAQISGLYLVVDRLETILVVIAVVMMSVPGALAADYVRRLLVISDLALETVEFFEVFSAHIAQIDICLEPPPILGGEMVLN